MSEVTKVDGPANRGKRAPPTAEEIEEARLKKQKMQMPEGMSKSEWKRQLKQQKWEESKDEYRKIKREKKKAAAQRKKESDTAVPKKKIPESQEPTGVSVIMDCDFDEYMNNKEIVSLSNQITRAYSSRRHSDYDVKLTITPFNKNLKKRFENALTHYKYWQNIDFVESESLAAYLPEDTSKHIYLTADTEEEIQDLEPGYTYIIGGIVDKNRHKKLCLNKAKKLGLKVARLPIGKYIEMNGRHVLATSHVYELMCKWFEHNKDWGKAFDEVLPARKVKGKVGESDESAEAVESELSGQSVETTDPAEPVKSAEPAQTTDSEEQTS